MDKIKVKKSFLNRLNNAEHDFLHRSCSQTLREKADSLSVIERPMARYLELYQQEDKAFKRSSGSDLTPKLKELDRLRDNYFINLRQSVRLLIRKGVEPMRTQAIKVLFVIDCYKKTALKAYAESTDLVFNLLQDLSEDPYPDLIAALGLTDELEELRTTNNAFHILYIERSMEFYKKSMCIPMIEAREMCDRAFMELISVINSCYEAADISGLYPGDIEQLKEVVREIAAFIEQSERVYNRRFCSNG